MRKSREERWKRSPLPSAATYAREGGALAMRDVDTVDGLRAATPAPVGGGN